jgi:hypothetical protein
MYFCCMGHQWFLFRGLLTDHCLYFTIFIILVVNLIIIIFHTCKFWYYTVHFHVYNFYIKTYIKFVTYKLCYVKSRLLLGRQNLLPAAELMGGLGRTSAYWRKLGGGRTTAPGRRGVGVWWTSCCGQRWSLKCCCSILFAVG